MAAVHRLFYKSSMGSYLTEYGLSSLSPAVNDQKYSELFPFMIKA